MNRKILVLFEDWNVSNEALRYAHALARRIQGELHLVLFLSSELVPVGETEALRRRGYAVLAERTATIDPWAVPVEHHVRVGDPWSEFCKFMATRGRMHTVVWGGEPRRLNDRSGSGAGHWATRIQEELGCPVVAARRRSSESTG